MTPDNAQLNDERVATPVREINIVMSQERKVPKTEIMGIIHRQKRDEKEVTKEHKALEMESDQAMRHEKAASQPPSLGCTYRDL